MGGQAQSEKAALKTVSGVSHGDSREEAPSAVLGWCPKSEAQGNEGALGVGSRAWRSQAQGWGGSGARMSSQVLNTGICGADQGEQGGSEDFAK